MGGSLRQGLKALRYKLWSNASVRAVLSLAIVMGIVTAISTVVLLTDLRHRELAHATGEIESLSRILSEQTTRTFDGVVLAMSGVRERLSDDFGRRLDLGSLPVSLLLRSRIAGLPQINSLFVVDAEGRLRNSSRKDFVPGMSVTDRDYFRHFLANRTDEVFISQPERSRLDQRWAFFVALRLTGDDGSFRGLVVASIKIEYFEALYESIALDTVSRILLLDRQGILLAGKRHDEKLLGDKGGNPETLEALRIQPGDGVIVKVESESAARWFVGYREVAKYPLVVSAAVEEDEALIPWWHIVRPVVSGVALVLVFLAGTTLLLVRSLLSKAALEADLKEGDDQLRHMVQSVRDAIVTIDSEKRVALFNHAAEHLFGIGAREVVGADIRQLLSRTLGQVQNANLVRYIEEGWALRQGESMLRIAELQRNGVSFPVELSISTIPFHGQTLLTAVFRDLSERRRAEHQLLESNRQLQELSAAVQNVREKERARIARELHDELGQSLTGIRMEVSWIGSRLLPENEGLSQRVVAIKSLIDQTIASVRRISAELRPLVLDDLGLTAAVSWYVDQFSTRTDIPVDLTLPDDDSVPGGAVATALFRVLQEALTNVTRHAQANHVEVVLQHRNRGWTLRIRDDGIGITEEAGERQGIGLLGMRERVQILGGRLVLESVPGQGTMIEVLIQDGRFAEDEDGKNQGSAG